MRQILLGTAAIALALALTTSANAGGKPGNNHSSGTHSNHGDYHLTHGSRFRDGSYFYRGHDHNHWTHSYWYGRYGCYTYWCPYTSCWYYWYPTTQCYYPVSYLPTYTPTPISTPVDVSSRVTQIVNVNNNSPASVVGDGPRTPLPPVVAGP
jgi:hypothetical protein